MEEEKKHSEILNEEINTYYKAKYSHLGTDLNQLIQQMNKDFYDEEYLLTDMLLRVEKKKDDMHELLNQVEQEYDKMQEINDQIFEEISSAKWKIEQYKQKEENIITYLNNLEKLDKTIDTFSIKKLQLNQIQILKNSQDFTYFYLPFKVLFSDNKQINNKIYELLKLF